MWRQKRCLLRKARLYRAFLLPNPGGAGAVNTLPELAEGPTRKGRPFCYMFFLYRVRFLPRTHALPVRVSSIRPAYSSTPASSVLTPGFSGFAGR